MAPPHLSRMGLSRLGLRAHGKEISGGWHSRRMMRAHISPLHRVSFSYTERPHATATAGVCCTRRAQADNCPTRNGRTVGTAATTPTTTAAVAVTAKALKKTTYFQIIFYNARAIRREISYNNKYHFILTTITE